MTTVRFAVSPGTRFVTLTRSFAFGLSLLIVSVAEAKVLPGFVLVAVKFAEVLSAVAVRPIRTIPASVMPARRLSLCILRDPFSLPLRRVVSRGPGRCGVLSVDVTFGPAVRGSIGAEGDDAAPLVVVPGRK